MWNIKTAAASAELNMMFINGRMNPVLVVSSMIHLANPNDFGERHLWIHNKLSQSRYNIVMQPWE